MRRSRAMTSNQRDDALKVHRCVPSLCPVYERLTQELQRLHAIVFERECRDHDLDTAIAEYGATARSRQTHLSSCTESLPPDDFVTLLERGTVTRSPENKSRYHRDALKVLRKVAKLVGHGKVRSNQAGPAVAGEVYLRTNRAELIVFGSPHGGGERGVVVRGVRVPLQNEWHPYGVLRDPDRLARLVLEKESQP